MNFEVGDVITAEFKWPNEKNKDYGRYPRACTIFHIGENEDGEGSVLHVVPHHGLPDGQTPDNPYAHKLSRGDQKQLNLLKTDRRGRPLPNQKNSWIIPNMVNKIQVPDSPALFKSETASGSHGWTRGRLSQGHLKEIARLQDLAAARGDMWERTIHSQPSSGLTRKAEPVSRDVASIVADRPRRKQLGLRLDAKTEERKRQELKEMGFRETRSPDQKKDQDIK